MMQLVVVLCIWQPICKYHILLLLFRKSFIKLCFLFYSLQPNGSLFTADPFFTPEKFIAAKPDFKKPETKNNTKSDESNDSNGSSNDLEIISKIQRVDLSDCRIRDLDLYRQILEDTLSLCREDIITPYISEKFSLRDVNKAVQFIKEKKCTGKVLIDLTSNDYDDVKNQIENEEKI